MRGYLVLLLVLIAVALVAEAGRGHGRGHGRGRGRSRCGGVFGRNPRNCICAQRTEMQRIADRIQGPQSRKLRFFVNLYNNTVETTNATATRICNRAFRRDLDPQCERRRCQCCRSKVVELLTNPRFCFNDEEDYAVVTGIVSDIQPPIGNVQCQDQSVVDDGDDNV